MISRRDLGVFTETAEGCTEGLIEDSPGEVGLAEAGGE